MKLLIKISFFNQGDSGFDWHRATPGTAGLAVLAHLWAGKGGNPLGWVCHSEGAGSGMQAEQELTPGCAEPFMFSSLR